MPLITTLANGSTRGYGGLLAGAAGAPNSYESIATATGTGSSPTITFSSIPQTYKHLQLRINTISTVAGNGTLLEINGLSTSIYDNHWVRGNGTAASASNSINTSVNFLPPIVTGTSTTNPNVAIVDIHNYTSTTQNKTVRGFGGVDSNGSGEVAISSGLWRDTGAITSLRIYMGSGNWTTSSTFALYGIKG